MKNNKKSIIINNISNSRGSSYLEFIFGMVAITLVVYTFVQFYFMMNAQLLILNTAKVALRNIEVFGGIPSQDSIANGVIGSIANNNNIDKSSITFTVNGEDINSLQDNKWYPYRSSITVVVKANYMFVSGLKLGPNFEVPLSARYVGSSQRMHPEVSADFVPITK